MGAPAVTAGGRPQVASPGPIAVYRDDGPSGAALGRLLGPVLRLPPVLLVLVAAAPAFVLMAVDGDGAPRGAVGAAVVWLALVGGGANGRPHRDPLAWMVPMVLRLAEYATLLWIGALAGGAAVPATFALLCVVAFRQYDLVYRLRYRGEIPPGWTGTASGGWPARVLVAYLAWLAGVLAPLLYAAAAVLAVTLVAESARGWIRFSRAERRVLFEDEDIEEDGL